jgi:hypothetical protein
MKHRPGQEGFSHAIIDAIPSPLFIVDDDVRIEDCNTAARALVGDPVRALHNRAGERLDCVNSRQSPEGCGRSAACGSCVVRNSVADAFHERRVVRKAQRMLIGDAASRIEVYFLVTTAPLATDAGTFAVLLLEDIGELMEARDVVPICMHCGRIRDGEQYWSNVDQYFKKHLDLDFSHGLCQDCLHKYYPDLTD